MRHGDGAGRPPPSPAVTNRAIPSPGPLHPQSQSPQTRFLEVSNSIALLGLSRFKSRELDVFVCVAACAPALRACHERPITDRRLFGPKLGQDMLRLRYWWGASTRWSAGDFLQRIPIERATRRRSPRDGQKLGSSCRLKSIPVSAPTCDRPRLRSPVNPPKCSLPAANGKCPALRTSSDGTDSKLSKFSPIKQIKSQGVAKLAPRSHELRPSSLGSPPPPLYAKTSLIAHLSPPFSKKRPNLGKMLKPGGGISCSRHVICPPFNRNLGTLPSPPPPLPPLIWRPRPSLQLIMERTAKLSSVEH